MVVTLGCRKCPQTQRLKERQKHLSAPGIWEQLSWVALAQEFLMRLRSTVSGGCCHLKAGLG